MARHEEREAVRGAEGPGRARRSGRPARAASSPYETTSPRGTARSSSASGALERRRPAQVDGHVRERHVVAPQEGMRAYERDRRAAVSDPASDTGPKRSRSRRRGRRSATARPFPSRGPRARLDRRHRRTVERSALTIALRGRSSWTRDDARRGASSLGSARTAPRTATAARGTRANPCPPRRASRIVRMSAHGIFTPPAARERARQVLRARHTRAHRAPAPAREMQSERISHPDDHRRQGRPLG